MADSVFQECAPEPCPDRFNMARYAVGDPAAQSPAADALLIVDGAAPEEALETWTFADADRHVRKAAGAMRAAGLRPGDRVLIRLGDGPGFPAAFFGAIAAGGVAMPLSSQLSTRELSRIAADAEPRLALLTEDAPGFDLCGADRLDAAALSSGKPTDYADTQADDPAFLVYTSGSSGTPKGVLHAQRSAWARRMMRAGWHGIGPGDRVIHAGAFNWTYTLGVGLSDAWSAGAAAIVNAGDRGPERWAGLAARWRPTVFAAVPGVYRRMLKYDSAHLHEGFASLRCALTAGEKLPENIRGGWEGVTGKPLHEALGMSELSTFISGGMARPARPETSGYPQPGRRVAILAENGEGFAQTGEAGLLAAHGSDPGLMLGYWRDPKRTALAFRGDWFITGDRASMDPDGAIRFLGRADDMMNAQGYRVAPQEVEEALATHPAIQECAAAEVTLEDGLSLIGAWVALKPGESVDEAALESHCATRLAAYKRPRLYTFVGALPRSVNGKLLRRALLRSAR